MLTSLALIFLIGLLLGKFFLILKLPSLLGMILTGMILGPYALDLLDPSILGISGELRQLALIVILTRAGLSLDLADLKKVGRPAILMCFVPASFEILGIVLLAPPLLGMTRLDAAILGTVLAAVSPAVIVPRMLKLMAEGYGTKLAIPQLLLAGASVDDVYVIVLFTALTGLAGGGSLSAVRLAEIPVAILLGILTGFILGWLLIRFFQRFHMRDTVKILIILSFSSLLLELEHRLSGIVPLSGLLAIMTVGMVIGQGYGALAVRLGQKYNKLWVGAEVLLFVLVGASVDLGYARLAGAASFVIVLGGLIFRMVGVMVSLFRTRLSIWERVFVQLAYTPKATVQAAIGGIPLALGLAAGQKILTTAVIAILVTAPLGAAAIDHTYRRLLSRESREQLRDQPGEPSRDQQP